MSDIEKDIEPLITEYYELQYGIGFKKVNKDAARRKIEDAWHLGSLFAQACMITDGWRNAVEWPSAVRILKKLADKGDDRALAVLVEKHFDDIIIFVPDFGFVADAMRRLGESSHAHAQYVLATCYENGRGITKNMSDAVKFYQKAAEQGHADAQCEIGKCFQKGQGVPQNYEEALKWFRMAYWSDHYATEHYLANCLHSVAEPMLGNDCAEAAEILWEAIEVEVTEDISRDFWTRTLPPHRLMAARAVVLAGESTDMLDEDIVKEVVLVGVSLGMAGLPWRPAVISSEREAKIESLVTDCDGPIFGIGFKKVDEEAARTKMEEAMILGSRYAEAVCMHKGWSFELDKEAAVALFHELAEAGDRRAMSMLGECLYFGFGVAEDKIAACHWWRQSNHPDAQFWLGFCYYRGYGVDQDYTEAARLYRMAAEKGHAWAQRDYGRCHLYGHGVDQDYKKAIKLFKDAYWSNPELCDDIASSLQNAAESLIDTDRIQSASLLWTAIEMRSDGCGVEYQFISRDFWTHTLPPLRLMAARAVILAGESTDMFHEGIVDEVKLVRWSLMKAGLPCVPVSVEAEEAT